MNNEIFNVGILLCERHVHLGKECIWYWQMKKKLNFIFKMKKLNKSRVYKVWTFIAIWYKKKKLWLSEGKYAQRVFSMF